MSAKKKISDDKYRKMYFKYWNQLWAELKVVKERLDNIEEKLRQLLPPEHLEEWTQKGIVSASGVQQIRNEIDDRFKPDEDATKFR